MQSNRSRWERFTRLSCENVTVPHPVGVLVIVQNLEDGFSNPRLCEWGVELW
jgi:hypothetical protein